MPSLIDPALFRETLGHYPTGVAVVTAVAEDGLPAGMVVGTFSSVSLNPPLIAFFPATSSGSFSHLRTAQAFCVNVLASDQEALCRQLATGGARKFDGVAWRPGPLGSPVLEGAVSWIECTYEDIRKTGDHYVVIGRVHALAIERSTLPLLFFQGGYGRFSPRSFIAAPQPELIQAAQLAESVRTQMEELSRELGVNCSVLAKVGADAIQVLAATPGRADGPLPLGHRQPIVPPLGAAFLVESTPQEVEEWLQWVPQESSERRERYRNMLETVRERGYSVLASEPTILGRHEAVLSEFERSERLPRQERAVQQVTSEVADLFCPDLLPGHLYDLASIVVPIPAQKGLPPMAIRLNGLPPSVSTEQIEYWTDRLKGVAATAAESMSAPRR